ncbi:MAG: DUF262 domain-containing HNH endonuclease family protein [Thiotrichaceae bacterium]|nr:DUF262 domain-containing HNH endonuclease family protein [Thiotrichaceae bacterium]
MAQQIECDKLLVKDLFSKWFSIPEYQRPYVWDKEQIMELLDDITQARTNSSASQYFLGSMVLRKNSKEERDTKYEEYDVLDGQQRLITLFLITAVIRDMSDDNDLKEACEKAIFQKQDKFSSVPERLRIVFDIRREVKDFIDSFVKQYGGTTKKDELQHKVANNKEDISIRNMAKAILTIRDYFDETSSISEFFLYLRLNVLMIYVSAEGLEDAFRLFTVMNNRGVKLRSSDILKADNLGMIQDDAKRLEYAEKWETAENYFGEAFDIFLSHLRTILVKRKASASLLKEFADNIYRPTSYDLSTKTRTYSQPLLSKGEKTFDFINKYKKHYEDLFDNAYEVMKNFERDKYELHNYLYLMKKGFEADFWVAPLLRFYDRFKTDKLIDFVKALDNKFAHDWLLEYTLAKRIEQVNAIIQVIDDAKTPNDVLQSTCLSLESKALLAKLEGNIYGKPTRARYILLKLDLLYHGHTTKFNPTDETISIEHILPQTPRDGSQWKIDFDKSQREEWTDKLGNLVLISRRKNSAQGNQDYADKKDKYFKGNVELFSNSIRIYSQYSTWSLADLTKNHAEVLAKIKQGFGIP